MQTAEQVFAQIEEEVKNRTQKRTIFVRSVQYDETPRQGDVYVTMLKKKPAGLVPYLDPNRQVAVGVSLGSRHCVSVGPELFQDPKNKDPLVGPVIVASERWTLTHPEHADVCLPSGTWQVTFQRDLAREERARVQD